LSTIRKLRIPALLGVGLMMAGVAPSGASSHREAPLITQDPVADNTDVYAFRSPDRPDTVTLVANWIPFEEPAGGPNFFNFGDDVLYQIHVDSNGDAQPDVTYEWRFTTEIQNPNTFLYNTGPITDINSPNFNERQFYDVSVVRNGARTVLGTHVPVPPNNIGPRSTPNYDAVAAQGVASLPGGVKSFAGQRDDPFYVDLGSAFDLLGLRPFNTAHKIPLPTAPGVDGLGGFNVNTIAIQVPISDLTTGGSPIIGVYSQTKRQQARVLSPTGPGSAPRSSGAFVNVSRLGNPLVNEVIIPLGEKDKFNASDPSGDAQFLPRVLDPEPARLISGLYPVNVPPAPRNDLVAIFLTGIPGLNQPPNVKPSEMIRLNTSIPVTGTPNPMGVLAGDNQGFPNGRRLGDDVVDIELRALAGATPFTPPFNVSPNNALGDGVNGNDKQFLGTFPYVASPHQGYDHAHHAVGSTSPQPAGPTVTSTPATTPTSTTMPATTSTTTVSNIPPGACVFPSSARPYIDITKYPGCTFSNP
jgi:hypothetical protein